MEMKMKMKMEAPNKGHLDAAATLELRLGAG
jgi:hypothetical protein